MYRRGVAARRHPSGTPVHRRRRGDVHAGPSPGAAHYSSSNWSSRASAACASPAPRTARGSPGRLGRRPCGWASTTRRSSSANSACPGGVPGTGRRRGCVAPRVGTRAARRLDGQRQRFVAPSRLYTSVRPFSTKKAAADWLECRDSMQMHQGLSFGAPGQGVDVDLRGCEAPVMCPARERLRIAGCR